MGNGDRYCRFAFSASSDGGRKAIATLALTASKRQDKALPIVKLETSSYMHRQFGKVWTPVFTIVGWESAPPALPERPEPPPPPVDENDYGVAPYGFEDPIP
jgi:hypothetical protein